MEGLQRCVVFSLCALAKFDDSLFGDGNVFCVSMIIIRLVLFLPLVLHPFLLKHGLAGIETMGLASCYVTSC